MTSLTSLIERIEAATEGSRELDVAVALAMGWRRGHVVDAQGWRDWVSPSSQYQVALPKWSTSIDAVRTLIPPPTECWWSIEQLRSPDSPMASFGPSGIFRAAIGFWKAEAYHVARHDDPVLALLAAILRARQTEGRHEES